MIKSLLKSVLGRFGLVIARGGKAGLSRDIDDVLGRAARLGLRPATVYDVGVAAGTPALYTTFPDAFHVMVEPLAEFEAPIRAWLEKYRGAHIPAAAAASAGELQINVHHEHLEGSSLLREQMGEAFDGEPRVVPAVTLDGVAEDLGLSGPNVLKIDVQGAELEVLEGAAGVLMESELVLLEVSLFQLMKDSPQFHDVVAWMHQRGFVVYDLYGGLTRPLDGALGQVDVAFVREDGMFRQDHQFASPKQWPGNRARGG